MNLSDRVRLLENRWYTDKETAPEAIIIHTVPASLDGMPTPITCFSYQGHEIHREAGELYQDFEKRAIAEAKTHLTHKFAVPTLLSDGSIED